MAAPEFYRVRVRAFAVIDGAEYDLTGLSLRYAINEIPSATIGVPLGREARTGKLAEIHNSGVGLFDQVPIQIYVTADDTTPVLNSGTYKVFDGYLSGGVPVTFSKSSGQAGVTIGCLDKLIQLHTTSIGNATLFSSVPENFFRRFDPSATNSGTKGVALSIRDAESIAKLFANDMWGFLRDILLNLADGSMNAYKGFPGFTVQNDAAIDILKNKIGYNRLFKGPLAISKMNPLLKTSIGDSFMKSVFSSLSGCTAWDKILQTANMFTFAIIPAADVAAPVPYSPCVSSTWRRISADQQYRIEDTRFAMRSIAALLLVRGAQMQTNSEDQDPNFLASVIGASSDLALDENPKRPIRGMVMIRTAPEWLLGRSSLYLYTQDTARISDYLRMAGNMVQRRTKPVPNEPEQAAAQATLAANAFARAWLYNELYKPRSLVLRGPLRLDIAPGSQLEIASSGLAGLGTTRASVTAVQVSVSATPADACTQLMMNHVRSGAELKNELDSHPLYEGPTSPADSLTGSSKAAWYGATLVENA